MCTSSSRVGPNAPDSVAAGSNAAIRRQRFTPKSRCGSIMGSPMCRYPLIGGLFVVVACAQPTAPTTGEGFSATRLAAGGLATCTLQYDFRLHCWGKSPRDFAPAPPDTVTCGRFGWCYPLPTIVRSNFQVWSLHMGGDQSATHVCGVMVDWAVDCIGTWRPLEDLVYPVGGRADIRLPVLATTVSAHSTHWCSLDPSGQAWCWGRFDYGKRGLPVDEYP